MSVVDMTWDFIHPINTWMAHFETKCIMNKLTMLLLADVTLLYVLCRGECAKTYRELHVVYDVDFHKC
jgi:hypothetical protein